MKKETILEVIEKELEQQLTDVDFAIDWNTKKHQIEIIVALFAENKAQEAIEDEDGVLSEEEVIEFEDAILLYTNREDVINSEEYLTTIYFDRKKGLSKEWIHEFAVYFNECLLEGQSDLLDFLMDERIETFELKWNETAFEDKIKKIETNTLVPYPKY